jgi:hypothetical protein
MAPCNRRVGGKRVAIAGTFPVILPMVLQIRETMVLQKKSIKSRNGF